MLHYNPQHVSSSTLPIFRRTNYIITASGIVTLEIGERSCVNKMRSAVLLRQLLSNLLTYSLQQSPS